MDFIFCIFHEAWSFVLLFKMDGNVFALNVSELRSILSFLPDIIQRWGLEDNIMSLISKFSFVFNNSIESWRELDFCKNLEDLNTPRLENSPPRCSTAADLRARHISWIRALVTSTSIYSCLYSKELVKPKVLDFRQF